MRAFLLAFIVDGERQRRSASKAGGIYEKEHTEVCDELISAAQHRWGDAASSPNYSMIFATTPAPTVRPRYSGFALALRVVVVPPTLCPLGSRGIIRSGVHTIGAQKSPQMRAFSVRLKNYYSIIFATTPAPTVRPPSRIAKRRPSSIAIGAISVTVSCTLSPGITISTPDGSSTAPVTSVVRK